jgi:hypothetical protein
MSLEDIAQKMEDEEANILDGEKKNLVHNGTANAATCDPAYGSVIG